MGEAIYHNHYKLSELTDKFFRGITREELLELSDILTDRRFEFITRGDTTSLAYDVANQALYVCSTLIAAFPTDAVIYSYSQYRQDNSLNRH